MEQRLKGVAHTYSQFINTVFGPLPKVQNILQVPTLIGVCQKNLFGVYIDNHIGVAKTFDAMYIFLYNSDFSRIAFGLVYLSKKKTRAFIDTLEPLGFEKSCGRLRPSAKHQDKIKQMPVLTF